MQCVHAGLRDKKMRRRFAQSINEMNDTPRFDSYITHVELSFTDACNYSCSFCPQSTHFDSDAVMSERTLQRALDHVLEFDHFVHIYVSGRGEPTLHPEFEHFIKTIYDRIKNTPHSLKMFTNGARLREVAYLIPCFDRLYLNIYDETPEEKRDALVRAFQFFYNVNIEFKLTSIPEFYGYRREFNKRYPIERLFSNRAGSVHSEKTSDRFVPDAQYASTCARPFFSIFVEATGDYSLCHDDWKHSLDLPSVHSTSMIDYVNKDPQFLRIANNLLQGRRDYSPCNRCNRKLEWIHYFTPEKLQSLKKAYIDV